MRCDPEVLLVGVYAGTPACATWEDLWWLTSRESAQLRRIGTPERQKEWLVGRMVAKWVVSLRGAAQSLAPGSLRHIEVEVDAWGKPVGQLLRRTGRPLTVALSLAHSQGMTVCAALGVGIAGQVGVDVEQVDRGILDLVERFTLPMERLALAGTRDQTLTATLLWGLKEAAIKCLGGVVVRRRSFEVHLEPKRTRARVMLLDPLLSERWGHTLEGGFQILGRHVLAWVSTQAREVSVVEVFPTHSWEEVDNGDG